MAFDDVRFPDDIAYGSVGGPSYRTDVAVTDGGVETRLSRITNARRKYNVAYGIRSYGQLRAVAEFFHARRGAANGFRFKDFMEYSTAEDSVSAPSEVDVVLGTGDGTKTTFQLVKYYLSGLIVRTRVLTHVIEETVVVAIDGVAVDPSDYSVNELTGEVTFNTAVPNGDIVTGGCEFDVPVRFAEGTDDWLQLSHDDFESGSAMNIELVELVNGGTITPDAFYYGGSRTVEPMTADYALSPGDRRVQVFQSNSNSRKVTLPDPDDMDAGGPHFVIFNTSGTFTMAVHDPGGSLVTLPTGLPNGGSSKTFWVGLDGSGNKIWVYT